MTVPRTEPIIGRHLRGERRAPHVAARERERVGGVGRLRDLAQVEQPGHHHLHRGLVGAAVAGDRELHLVRAVLRDRDAGARRGDEREPARLPDRHRGAGVGLEQHPLDRDRRRAAPRRRARASSSSSASSRSGSGSPGGVRITPHAERPQAGRARGRRRRSRSARARGRCRARARPDRTRVRSYDGRGPGRGRGSAAERSVAPASASRGGAGAARARTARRRPMPSGTRRLVDRAARRPRAGRSVRPRRESICAAAAAGAARRRPAPGARGLSTRCPRPRSRRASFESTSRSRFSTNWPISFDETSASTPAPELRDLAGDREIGDDVDHACRRRRRSSSRRSSPSRCPARACRGPDASITMRCAGFVDLGELRGALVLRGDRPDLHLHDAAVLVAVDLLQLRAGQARRDALDVEQHLPGLVDRACSLGSCLLISIGPPTRRGRRGCRRRSGRRCRRTVPRRRRGGAGAPARLRRRSSASASAQCSRPMSTGLPARAAVGRDREPGAVVVRGARRAGTPRRRRAAGRRGRRRPRRRRRAASSARSAACRLDAIPRSGASLRTHLDAGRQRRAATRSSDTTTDHRRRARSRVAASTRVQRPAAARRAAASGFGTSPPNRTPRPAASTTAARRERGRDVRAASSARRTSTRARCSRYSGDALRSAASARCPRPRARRRRPATRPARAPARPRSRATASSPC